MSKAKNGQFASFLWSSHSSSSSDFLNCRRVVLARAYDGSEWACGNLLILDTILGAVGEHVWSCCIWHSYWHFYHSSFWTSLVVVMKNYKKAYCSIVPPTKNPPGVPAFLLQSYPDFFLSLLAWFQPSLAFPPPCRHPRQISRKKFLSLKW